MLTERGRTLPVQYQARSFPDYEPCHRSVASALLGMIAQPNAASLSYKRPPLRRGGTLPKQARSCLSGPICCQPAVHVTQHGILYPLAMEEVCSSQSCRAALAWGSRFRLCHRTQVARLHRGHSLFACPYCRQEPNQFKIEILKLIA